MQHSILVGTSKGLVIFDDHQNKFQISKVHFPGFPVSMAFVDERDDTWWVSLSHKHWGEKLHYSRDKGKTWLAANLPSYSTYNYRPNIPATLKKIWVMSHAGKNIADGLWLGSEPGGLFFSDDNGTTFSLNEGLWNHPSRIDDHQWFGTGNDYPFIHSILVDPRDNQHIYVGVSCAGVFESLDGGKTWHAKNNGLIASYLPKANAEIGHDPHQMILCHSNPDVIWQQNHCGIFRTANGGNDWQLVSGENGFPSYGFALAIDHSDCNTAWVIPAESDESRVPKNLALKVCKTTDGGKHWIEQISGLPQTHTFDIVLRHGLIKCNDKLVFGTNNGNIYLSEDNGENWSVLANNLAPISTLAASHNQH